MYRFRMRDGGTIPFWLMSLTDPGSQAALSYLLQANPSIDAQELYQPGFWHGGLKGDWW